MYAAARFRHGRITASCHRPSSRLATLSALPATPVPVRIRHRPLPHSRIQQETRESRVQHGDRPRMEPRGWAKIEQQLHRSALPVCKSRHSNRQVKCRHCCIFEKKKFAPGCKTLLPTLHTRHGLKSVACAEMSVRRYFVGAWACSYYPLMSTT